MKQIRIVTTSPIRLTSSLLRPTYYAPSPVPRSPHILLNLDSLVRSAFGESNSQSTP